jgi:DHA3 family macrolide efflux protein-like MFS transporter
MPLIIPKENLLKYSGYSQAIQSISLIISPVVASFLYEQIKLSYIIFLDVIGAIIAIFSVFISVIPNIKLDTSKTSFIKDTKEAFKLILSKPKIKALFLFTAIFMIVFMPINSLFPLMTKNYFGGTTYHAGIIEMLFAVGMLIGSILLSTTKHFKDEKRNILIALLLMGISLLISGLISSSQFIIFTIMALVMGFTGPIFNGTTSTILGKEIEPEFLGRVFSNYISLSVLSMPIGLLLVGMFADKIGVNVWFIISGSLILIMALIWNFVKAFNNKKQ